MCISKCFLRSILCISVLMSQSVNAGSLGIDWPPTEIVNGKYVLGPSYEACEAFGDRYAQISSDITGLNWDEGTRAAGNYFHAPRVVRSMETNTEWVCLIQYVVGMVEGGQWNLRDALKLQELHHVNKLTGKFRTTPTELNDR